MTIAQRVLLADFALANPLYANARVWVYEAVVETGLASTSLATLYRAPNGTDEEANPITLDSQGKLQRAVYVDAPVVARVTDALVPVHDTGVIGLISRYREAWETAAIYQVGDIARDDEAGNDTGYLYICAEAHTAGDWDDDLAAGKWVLYLQGGSGGGGGGSGVEGEFTISLDVGTAYDNYLHLEGDDTGNPVVIEARSDVDDDVTLRLLPKGNAPVWAQRFHMGDTAPTVSPTNTFSRFNITYPVQALSSASYGAARIGGNLFGTLSGSPVGVGFQVVADSDAVDATDGFQLVYFGHNVSSTSAVGGRTVGTFRLNITANVSSGTLQYYTAGARHTIASGGLGGVKHGERPGLRGHAQ